MAESLHPAAPHDLPFFITAPGQTDGLMIGTAIFLLLFVIALGVLYFRLHHLPEHIASKSKKTQLEIVSVLTLIAMFTQEHIFWIAGLLLAFIEFPDFGALLNRIADATAKVAYRRSGEPAPETSPKVLAAPQEPAEPRGVPPKPTRADDRIGPALSTGKKKS
jgi:hypothetical protein